jgi:hypothetical protein
MSDGGYMGAALLTAPQVPHAALNLISLLCASSTLPLS